MIEEALSTLLLAAAAITAIVDDRVYPAHLPQDATLPAISFSRVAETETEVSHSRVNYEGLFQFSCWANDPKSAKELALAVRAVLNPDYRGTVGDVEIKQCHLSNQTELPDADLGVYQEAVDIQLKYRTN